jgi:hypothetical protein
MDDTIQRYWNAAHSLLLQFRAGAFGGSTDQLHSALLETARNIDTNYRSSPYNLPSLYQDQINLIKGQTVKLAQKWLNDGKPQVPAV